MKFGLKESLLKNITSIFSDFPDVQSVIIYGSRAKGNFKPGSDIDLVLKGKKLNLTTLNLISLKIDDLLLPYSFDMSLFDYIESNELIDHINRKGKLLYHRENKPTLI